MSISTVTYVGYGVILPYPEHMEEDVLEPFVDNIRQAKIGNKNGVTIVLDCMSGNECFIGLMIAKSERDCPINMVAIPTVKPHAFSLDRVIEEYNLNNGLPAEYSWIIYTNYI